MSAKWAKGEPARIMITLATVTAILSAFLDNGTTVLLIVPVTFAIAEKLKLNPVPFLIAEVLASNIGGTATLIGDPPNNMIGSATGPGFISLTACKTPSSKVGDQQAVKIKERGHTSLWSMALGSEECP